MMCRPLTWICLIVALAGPSLAHAEAADDLARSLVGARDEGQVRPIDGGVGDDPVEAAFGPAAPASGSDHADSMVGDDRAGARIVGLGRPGSSRGTRRFRRDSWPLPHPTRRHVWLQTFRI